LEPQQIVPGVIEHAALDVQVTMNTVPPLLDPELLATPPLDPLEPPLELPLEPPLELPLELPTKPPLLDPDPPPESPLSGATEPAQPDTDAVATANAKPSARRRCMATPSQFDVVPELGCAGPSTPYQYPQPVRSRRGADRGTCPDF
jgi:hypothetical protein